MTTLTLIYAADTAGNFTDPETGKRWDIPESRVFLRKTIKDRSVICGRRTFEQDWPELMEARSICVLTRMERPDKSPSPAYAECLKRGIRLGWRSRPVGVLDASLDRMRSNVVDKEIFCIGGKETIEALAPFASRIVATDICMAPEVPDDYDEFPRWLPEHISVEVSDMLLEGDFWESLPCDVGSHYNLNWRFGDMKLKNPIKL